MLLESLHPAPRSAPKPRKGHLPWLSGRVQSGEKAKQRRLPRPTLPLDDQRRIVEDLGVKAQRQEAAQRVVGIVPGRIETVGDCFEEAVAAFRVHSSRPRRRRLELPQRFEAHQDPAIVGMQEQRLVNLSQPRAEDQILLVANHAGVVDYAAVGGRPGARRDRTGAR